MQRKHLLCRSIGIVLAVSILFALLFVSSPILARKDSKEKFHDFYQHAADYDVLFFGSSHILNAVNPMDIWRENGIASFNMGVSGCRLGMSYWMLRNALEYSKPEVIVLDCAYLKDEKASPNKEYNHGALDAIYHLPTKAEAVFDLFDTTEDRVRYLFPFSLYHNRWSELTERDFLPLTSNNKMGFEGLDSVVAADLPEFSNDVVEHLDTVSVDYLRRIISLCKERNIQILLTFLPYSMNETSLKDAAFVQKIADEYDVHYLGPGKIEDIIDPSIDFANDYDDNSHLNLSGAHKVSVFLGNYIAATYSVENHRGNTDYAYLDELYASYQQNNYTKLDHQVVLDEYLVTLSTCNANTIIEMQDCSALAKSTYLSLFNNIGVDVQMLSQDTDCIMIRENGKDIAYYEHFAKTGNTLQTILGEITFTAEDGENSSYALNGMQVRKINHNMGGNTVSIVAMDSVTNKIISKISFDIYSGIKVGSGNYTGSIGGGDGTTIVVEESSGGYWSASEYNPTGEFMVHEECSAKRTSMIPVTPGDQFLYKGNGTKYVPSVVWLDADQKYISKAYYAAEGTAETIIVPENAAYVWFASFQYTTKPAKVVLDVVWVLRQAEDVPGYLGGSTLPVEEAGGGYWSANEYNPTGEFMAHEKCSAKRTSILPVTPGDQFIYKGNGTKHVPSVVWLDANQKYIDKAYYAAEGAAETITVPENAAYVWFSSFQYTTKPAKVILDVAWVLRQVEDVPDQQDNTLPVEESGGGYWSASEYNPTGAFMTHKECSAKRTSIIPVTPGEQFLYKGNGTKHVPSVVWLDANQKYISKEYYAAEGSAETITVPQNAAYAWFSSFQYTSKPANVVLDVVRVWNQHADTFSKLNGKMIIYDGDSIAAGQHFSAENQKVGYAEIIAELTGCKYKNYAKGGGHLTSNNKGHSVIDMLPNLSKAGDLYCFEGGINDFWANTPIGKCIPGDFSGPLTTNTICGAMEYIFRYCRENIPEKPVCFIIVHKVKNTAVSKNANGDTFTDYRNAMIEVCKKYSVPYYDAFAESGLDGSQEMLSNLYLTGSGGKPDGIHPNRAGYEVYYVPQLIKLFAQMLSAYN